jgi:hypothetical protein
MARTDFAEVLDEAKDGARDLTASTLDAVSSALDVASTQGKKVGHSAGKKAKQLADDAKTSGRKARKRADKAAKKTKKKAKGRAHDLNVTVQQKAGRKPKRGRKAAVLGGVALAGVAVATVVSRKKAAAETAQSEVPGDRPTYQ